MQGFYIKVAFIYALSKNVARRCHLTSLDIPAYSPLVYTPFQKKEQRQMNLYNYVKKNNTSY